jgi:hypothetical protein
MVLTLSLALTSLIASAALACDGKGAAKSQAKASNEIEAQTAAVTVEKDEAGTAGTCTGDATAIQAPAGCAGNTGVARTSTAALVTAGSSCAASAAACGEGVATAQTAATETSTGVCPATTAACEGKTSPTTDDATAQGAEEKDGAETTAQTAESAGSKSQG